MRGGLRVLNSEVISILSWLTFSERKTLQFPRRIAFKAEYRYNSAPMCSDYYVKWRQQYVFTYTYVCVCVCVCVCV